MFSVDGIQWDVPCEIERVAEVRSSDISGLMLDRSWFNDVLGTYLRYTVRLAVPFSRRDGYARLYEALTAPVDGHAFTLPYNGGTVEITARVEALRDVYAPLPGGGSYWKGVRFELVANHPTREVTLGEAVTRGRAPLPEAASPAEGDLYEYRGGAWVVAGYAEADEVGY